MLAWGSIVLSSSAPPVAAASGPGLTPVVPARVLETRPGQETIDGQYQGQGPRSAGSVLELKVTGRGGVPAAGVDAVMLNVTAVGPTASGFLTVFPCGSPRPNASNVNYQPGDVVPNMVFAKVGAGGNVCIYTFATTNILVDVSGYVAAGGSLGPVVPARVLETRPGQETIDGQYQGQGPRSAGSVLELKVTGRGGVPAAGVDAVMLNVTAVGPTASGFLTVFPCGSPRPNASNVNYQPGDVVPNMVFAKVGAGGNVCIYTFATTNILVDVSGYVGLPVFSDGTPDLPGKPVEVPGVIASVIDKITRPVEVYSVGLAAGQTVLFETDVAEGRAYFDLYAPGTTILWDIADREFRYYSPSPTSWTFTPAVSGTYYLRISTVSYTGQAYTLKMSNGPQAPVSDAPDDLPGEAIVSPGSVSSVIDKITRPVEVYSVGLAAGQTVLFETDVAEGRAYFDLYAPGTTILWDIADREFRYYSPSPTSWTFTPAVSGTYYLRISTVSYTGQAYTLKMRNV
jgi:protein involved in polysaccharide export with SLBB domain